MLSVLFGIGYGALADSAGQAGEGVGVHVPGVVEGVTVLVLAVVALELSALKNKQEIADLDKVEQIRDGRFRQSLIQIGNSCKSCL